MLTSVSDQGLSTSSAQRHTVGFFETAAELDRLLEWSSQASTDLSLVALTPEADYAAERRGLPYYTIEDLYSEEELLKRGLENFSIVEQLCAEFDRRLHASLSSFPFVRRFSLRHQFYHMKILMDALLHRTFTLKSALETFVPATVVCFVAQLVTDTLYFLDESLFSLVLQSIARQMGCSLVQLTPILKANPVPVLTPRQRFRRLLSVLPGGQSVLKSARQLRTRLRSVTNDSKSPSAGVPNKVAPSENSSTIILTNYWSDKEVLDCWVASGGRIVGWRELLQQSAPEPLTTAAWPDSESMLRPFWDSLVAEESFRTFFQIEGLDLFSVVEERLRYIVFNMIAKYLSIVVTMDRALETLPNPIVLGSALLNIEDVACVAAARHRGIPTVVHQHGGFVGYPNYPMLRYSELQLADYFLCYGEGVCEHVNRTFSQKTREENRTIAQPIAVGSAALDRLRAESRELAGQKPASVLNHDRRAMYITTGLMSDLRYFSKHIYPDIWYWRLQREVVRVCSQFPDIQLLI